MYRDRYKDHEESGKHSTTKVTNKASVINPKYIEIFKLLDIKKKLRELNEIRKTICEQNEKFDKKKRSHKNKEKF